jgi:hypothetical protein
MRNRSLLAFAALLALVAAACATHPDERTHVTAAGASGGVTVSGTVDSFSSDAVVITTSTGKETIQIDGNTVGREHLTVGRQISIDVLRSGRAALAKEIRVPDSHDH